MYEFKGGKDQITTFIQQHDQQAGIQHLGFTCTVNIKDAVRMTQRRGAQYLTPMPKYYLKVSVGSFDWLRFLGSSR